MIHVYNPGHNITLRAVMYGCLCQAGKRGYSEWVDEIHQKEHPQCRKLRRSRVYLARSG
jgi:hypothetical protein